MRGHLCLFMNERLSQISKAITVDIEVSDFLLVSFLFWIFLFIQWNVENQWMCLVSKLHNWYSKQSYILIRCLTVVYFFRRCDEKVRLTLDTFAPNDISSYYTQLIQHQQHFSNVSIENSMRSYEIYSISYYLSSWYSNNLIKYT